MATTRGYPYPAGDDDFDVPGDIQALAEAINDDVDAVATARDGTASDLLAHEADTTSVHGIADTSALVTTARAITAGTGLSGGGTLAADRTIGIAAGGVGTTRLADDAVTSAKIGDGTIVDSDINAAAAIAATKINGTAVVQARQVATSGPLSGGGDLSADRTLTVAGGAITPIYLGGGYAAKTGNYTLTDDDHEVDFTAAPYTATLPSAVGRAGRVFIVRNSAASGTVTVSGASVTIPGPGYVIVRSNGATWTVIEGAYATSAVGLASYRWNASSAAWRLIAYDTGLRDITAVLGATGCTVNSAYVRRTLNAVTVNIDVTINTPTSYQSLGSIGGGGGFASSNNMASNDFVIADTSGTVTAALFARYSGPSLGLYRSGGGGLTAALEFVGTATYVPSTTLPTSLPGTQVTAPV